MKKNMLQKGFTLIELLVVIAIIGILAAVVLGSLNDARSGGQDASAKQSITNLRAQAELFYNSNTYSYSNLCADTTKIAPLVQAAVRAVGGTATYAAGTHGLATSRATNSATPANRLPSCHSDATQFMVVTPLATGNTGFWCVDSTGNSKALTGVTGPAAGTLVCP